MSEYSVEGPELKKMVKLARKAPLPFAFNPGKSESEHYFAMHRKRAPGILGKAAKKDGPGVKVAFGTCIVDGKVMELTCERVVPAMARSLKRFLKSNKVSLNVKILDAQGNVLEEDIEDLPDDPSLYDADAPAAAEPPEAAEDADAPAAATTAPDTAGIVARVKAAQPRVAAAPAAVAEKLRPALEAVVAQLKAQDLQAADQAMTRIEAVLDKLPAAQPAAAPEQPAAAAARSADPADIVARIKAAQPLVQQAPAPVADKLKEALARVVQQVKAGELDPARATMDRVEAALNKLGATAEPGAGGAAEPAAQQTDDARLSALVERAKALQPRMAAAPEAAAAKLQKALQAVVASIKAKDAGAAESGLTKIEAALDKLAGAAAPRESAAQAVEDPRIADLAADAEALRQSVTALPAGDVQSQLLAQLEQIAQLLSGAAVDAAIGALDRIREALKLQAEVDRIMPDFVAAMSSGKVEDPNKLSVLFNTAVELVPGPDHAKAWQNLKLAEDMIAAGAALEKTAQQAEIPADVRPFAMSRLKWNDTRRVLKSEIEKLQAAILKVCAGDEDLKEIADNVGNLTGYIEKLDARLEDKLDEIVNSPQGDAREALKKQARALLAEYQSELDTPFFSDVDSGNGFADVAVASTARAALREIDKVLTG